MKITAMQRRRRTLFLFLGALGLTLSMVGRLEPRHAVAEPVRSAPRRSVQREPKRRGAGAIRTNTSARAPQKVYVANLGTLADDPRHRASVGQTLSWIQDANRLPVLPPLRVQARSARASNHRALVHQASFLQGWTGCDSFARGCTEQGACTVTRRAGTTWLLGSVRRVADQLAVAFRAAATATSRGLETALVAPPDSIGAATAATARRPTTDFDAVVGLPRFEL